MSETTPPLQTPGQQAAIAAMKAYATTDPQVGEWTLPTYSVSEGRQEELDQEREDQVAELGGRVVAFVNGQVTTDTTRQESQRQPKTNRIFPEHYTAPDDQLTTELELMDAYSEQFPESKDVLASVLDDVKSFTGMNIPKYKVVDEDLDRAQQNGVADELGFLGNPNSQGLGRAKLQLKMPVKYTEEQYAAMSEPEQYAANKSEEGLMIIGELPNETRAMIEGVYQLTGASVIRDGRQEGEDPGKVLREGIYQGSKVYFSEYYHDTGYYKDMPTFSLAIVGERAAHYQLINPNMQEKAEFSKISGVPIHNLNKVFAENNVTRDNYRQVADVFAATRDIFDGKE